MWPKISLNKIERKKKIERKNNAIMEGDKKIIIIIKKTKLGFVNLIKIHLPFT